MLEPLLVDTNVLVDVLEDDPDWVEWSLGQLRAQSLVHALAINPVVYAELSMAFNSMEALNEVVERLGLKLLELPRPALFLAGKAFAQYRSKGGKRPKRPADFLIGAHAAVLGCPLLTRDVKRYRNCFPGLRLVGPP